MARTATHGAETRRLWRHATRLCAAAGLAASLAACAVSKIDPKAETLPPPPVGAGAEERITENYYRVSFAADGDYTRAERQAGLLQHAAEVTLDAGYDHFIVVSRETVYADLDERDYDDGLGVLGDIGVGIGVFGGSSSGVGLGITLGGAPSDPTRTAVAEVADVALGRGPAPEDDIDAYDARIILRGSSGAPE